MAMEPDIGAPERKGKDAVALHLIRRLLDADLPGLPASPLSGDAMIARAIGRWDALAPDAGPPAPADFFVAADDPLAPHHFLLDLADGAAAARIVSSGRWLGAFCEQAELTERRLAACLDLAVWETWRYVLRVVLESGKPLPRSARFFARGARLIDYDSLFLPVRRPGSAAPAVLGFLSYRPVRNPPELVAAAE